MTGEPERRELTDGELAICRVIGLAIVGTLLGALDEAIRRAVAARNRPPAPVIQLDAYRPAAGESGPDPVESERGPE